MNWSGCCTNVKIIFYTVFCLCCYSFFVVSCDNIDCSIVEDEIVYQDGTDMLSFFLSDGDKEFHSFAIVDSLILVKVPNQENVSAIKAFFKHNGKNVTVNNVVQQSGVSKNDFSDTTNPVQYTVTSISGEQRTYTVLIFDIPVVYINTEGKQPIQNREDWLPAKLKIVNNGGDIYEYDIQIKGRGNGSWETSRKSYSIKMNQKESMLDLPKSKRWVLLGQVSDWTKIRTAISFELSKLVGFEWSPSGYNVDFVLNDTLRCNYFFCEQIRVEKNRINIQEMTPADTLGESLTGGVLFEVSSDYDEIYKFRTEKGDFPFMFKNPDEGLHEKQFVFFRDYINGIEDIIYSEERLRNNEFLSYLDIDSYIKWWLVHEMTMNLEESYFVKNFYMYKNRGYGTLLTAGPPWDFDWGTFRAENIKKWLCKNKFWYSQLFNNPLFVSRVKEIWSEVRPGFSTIDDFYRKVKCINRQSVLRDQFLHPTEYSIENLTNFHLNDEDGMYYDEACDYIKKVFDLHLLWMDIEISRM